MHDLQATAASAAASTESRAVEARPPARERREEGSFALYRARSQFGSLDGLRALSILAVIWHHAFDEKWFHALLPGSRFGFLGVDLFFAISGFLIVTLLLRERERKGAISLRHFYLRRSLRIFPVYYGVIALFCIVYAVRQNDKAAAFFHDLPYLLTYLTNWFPAAGIFAITWSLAAEEQFYLFWPPLERFFKNAALPVLLGLIALSQLIAFGALDGPMFALGFEPHEPTMLRQTTFTPILLGVLLAHALHHEPTFTRLSRLLGQRFAASLLFALLFAVPQLLPDDISAGPRLLVHLLMVALLASTVLREEHGIAPLLKQPVLQRIGKLSYGLYLFHMIAIGVADALLRRLGVRLPFALLILGCAIAYGFAELSYRYYESRFLRLKQRFS